MPSPQHQDFLWIVLGDIHEEIDSFADIPELQEADGIIISGDITVSGHVQQAEQVLFAITRHKEKVFAQIGNMDKGEVTDWLTEKGWNIHADVRQLSDNVAIFGVGASTVTPFGTPSEFPESRFTSWLEQAWDKARHSPQRVLISHNPPSNTLCDIVGDNIHVGSTAVRHFIETYQPDICICGHIHEARSMDCIGRTLILNPGNFGSGGYVVLRSCDGQLSAEIKVLKHE